MLLKKNGFLTSLIIVVIVANVSFGQWLWWTNDATNRLWVDTGNWTAYPTSGDDVVVGTYDTTGPILNTGETGYANWLHICDTTPTGSKVTVNGGTLQVSDHLFVGQWGTDQKGILQVDSGIVNTTLLMCGGDTDGSQGDGTLLMNGGTVNISWLLAVAGGYSGTNGNGVGHIQLDDGTIDVTGGGGLVMSDNGSIDITGGSLILNGEITDVTTYGDVTAYDGIGSFIYSYDSGRTTITAVIPEPITLVFVGLGALLLRKKMV
ncbi:MAG: hypothetical protein WC496_03750 [Phycisphaerae bacterium]|jgi:hypothetical protein